MKTTQRRLLRDFLSTQLYGAAAARNVSKSSSIRAENNAYFMSKEAKYRIIQQESKNLGEKERRRWIRSLVDAHHYYATVSKLYEESDGEWSTPSELFSPLYAKAFMRCATERWRASEFGRARSVLEIGGGTGTFASDSLSELRDADMLDATTWQCLEISPILANVQRERIDGELPYSVRVASVLDAMSAFPRDADESVATVLCMEVLDNMMHDKVRLVPVADTVGGDTTVALFGRRWSVQQALVHVGANRTDVETFEPLSDTLIRDTLRYMEAHEAHRERLRATKQSSWWPFQTRAPTSSADLPRLMFVPTTHLQLIRNLRQYTPRATWMMADFDSFDTQLRLPGINAPLVQHRGGELDSYLNIPERLRGRVDIMFAVQFDLLAFIWQQEGGGDVHVEKQCEFLRRHLDVDELRSSTTKSGFNPLLEDFSNASVLIAMAN